VSHKNRSRGPRSRLWPLYRGLPLSFSHKHIVGVLQLHATCYRGLFFIVIFVRVFAVSVWFPEGNLRNLLDRRCFQAQIVSPNIQKAECSDGDQRW